jgi:phage tail tape-measure protein
MTSFPTRPVALLATLAAALGACTSTGNIERNAAGGAVAGGLIGAVIGNNTGSGDAGNGAATGAVIGGVAGAVRGYSLDERRAECAAATNSPTYRDANGRGYFYATRGANRTCWSSDRSPRGL